MSSKKIKFLKFASIFCLAVVFFYVIANTIYKDVDVKVLPGIAETKIENPLVNSLVNPVIIPVKMNAYLRDSIVEFGVQLLGTPYIFGACSEDGFDCSGFVYFVFQHFEIKIPRSSSEFKDFGGEVPIGSVRKGDILVFLSPTRNEIGHVGIVTIPNGMESEFIHASSGADMKVIISSLNQEGYRHRFVKAVDVL